MTCKTDWLRTCVAALPRDMIMGDRTAFLTKLIAEHPDHFTRPMTSAEMSDWLGINENALRVRRQRGVGIPPGWDPETGLWPSRIDVLRWYYGEAMAELDEMAA